MSLDRQRILSELGSVMNQLKSADCGCMGKLFSNQSQGQGASMGAPLPTCGGCRRGHCHGHGFSHNTPCAGEPYSMGHSMNHHCMGHCNPPKLYADTYSYLNNNLMQPAVKEVYNDLKSINPANTVMNNPLANQMGLSGNTAGGNAGNISNPMQNVSGMDTGNANMPMGQSQQPLNPMSGIGGMGPQIVNMIMGDSGMKPSNVQRMPTQGGQAAGSMGNVPQTSPGQGGNMIMPADINSARYIDNSGNMNANMGNINQPNNISGFADPQTQYISKENMYSLGNSQGNPSSPGGNPQIGNMNNSMNPAYMGSSNVHQMSATNQPQYGQNVQSMMPNMNPNGQQIPAKNKTQYGQHNQGITKFNEMFPGVMQGGDLGFDPMAIAIQMNPANQQKAAMDSMQRLMTNGPAGKLMETAGNPAVMKPVMDATKTAVETINPAPGSQGQQNVLYKMSNQQLSGQQQVLATQNSPPTQMLNQQIISAGQQQGTNLNAGGAYQSEPNAVPHQQVYTAVTGQQQATNPNVGGGFQSQPNAVPQQQVYTAVTGQPMLTQQQMQAQQIQSFQQPPDSVQQYQQQQNMYDPNTGAISRDQILGQDGMINPNAQSQPRTGQIIPQSDMPPPQPMVKEPIFPADTSRNRPITYTKPQQRYYQYNTLGQPVEMLPAKMFHPPEPSLPQTLSPQPLPTKPRNDYMRYSNVKSTVSKTSLAGNRPVGRTPSRSQLQHIYNQYKGSQSFTQQNVKPPVHGNTFSEGRLNIPPENTLQQVPVEKVGGDTAANNQINSDNRISNKVGQVMGQVGDVPVADKPQNQTPPQKGPGSPIPARQSKLRNGLQDVIYTSYPSSAAWSFHGTNTYRPASVGYRFRNFK